MSRNGSGTYSLPAGNPVSGGTVISSTWANSTLSDISTALTESIAKDGQTVPTANLPMGTYKHTNVAVGAALTDYARYDQLQNSAPQWLTSVSGADTITASAPVAPAAYAAGQTFRFVSAGANTGAVTLNVNGLGAKDVTKNGTTALTAGDIASGAIVTVTYDGTRFQIASSASISFAGDNTWTGANTFRNAAGIRSEQAATQDAIAIVGRAGGTGSYEATITPTTLTADRTITVPDASGTMALLGPAFIAYRNASQSVTTATWTKAAIDTEIFDSGSYFDTANNRFLPLVAGYYQISGGVLCNTTGTLTEAACAIYKNGAVHKYGSTWAGSASSGFEVVVSDLVFLNGSTDYVEMWGRLTTASGPAFSGGEASTRMSGFLAYRT